MATTFTNPAPGAAFGITANVVAASSAAPAAANVNDVTVNNFTAGTNASNVDRIYSATFATSTNGTTLNLTSLTDPIGGAVNFAHVTVVKLSNLSTVAGQDVTLGGGTTSAFCAAFPVPAYGGSVNTPSLGSILGSSATNGAGSWVGFDATAAPIAVTNAVNSTLRVIAATGSPSCALTILGRST